MEVTPSNMSSDEGAVPGGGRDSVLMVILMVMLSIFSVVGSVGNGMVIFVFQRIRDKTTAQVFIITMAVIDLFTCMVIIPYTMMVEYIEFNLKYDFFCRLYHFLITSKVPLSAFIMVAIAFDRYFCICHPLKRIVTLRRVKLILIFLTLLACLLGVITSLFYSVYQVIERIDAARIDQILGTNFTQSIANLDRFDRLCKVSDKDVDEGKILNHGPEVYLSEKEKIMRALHERNITFEGVSNDSYPVTKEVVYLGVCNPSAVSVGPDFLAAYKPIHTAVWPTCLITVVVLYMMIYRFMCLRRSKKLQQKLIMCSYVNGDGTYENTRLVSCEVDDTRRNTKNLTVSASSIPSGIPTSVSAYELGSSSMVIRTTSSCHASELHLNGDAAGKHGHNLLGDNLPRGKLSFSAPPTTISAVTPTEHDDDTPILNKFYNISGSSNNNNNASGQGNGGRRHSHLPEQKYHWHKNRDSMKRYKGKTKRRKPQHNYEADRLRDENRSANVRTAVMLFTVTIVFVVAFVPSLLMILQIISHNVIVFYIYFIYNVANPFIYAFMNHIFKDYMRKMFVCQDVHATSKRSHLTVLTI